MLPSQTAEDSLLIRNAVFVVKLKELRFVAVIATKSFMLHVLGNKDTSLVLRSNPSVLPRYSGDIQLTQLPGQEQSTRYDHHNYI
jgi:hypothetical protein